MRQHNSSAPLLITGATGGMGHACALLAAKRGYALYLLDLSEPRLSTLAQECIELGATVNYRSLDISDTAAVAAFIAAQPDQDAFCGLIHTVGLSPQMADWQRIVDVDLLSTVAFAESVRPRLAAGSAAVVFASMSAHMVTANADIDALLRVPFANDVFDALAALPEQPLNNPGLAYAYSKRALLDYVRREAGTWGRESKRLLSLSPGLIDTEMGQQEAAANKDGYDFMRGLIALKRDGHASEIAGAALFLVSEDAAYISGCDLQVDGGFVGAFNSSRS